MFFCRNSVFKQLENFVYLVFLLHGTSSFKTNILLNANFVATCFAVFVNFALLLLKSVQTSFTPKSLTYLSAIGLSF